MQSAQSPDDKNRQRRCLKINRTADWIFGNNFVVIGTTAPSARLVIMGNLSVNNTDGTSRLFVDTSTGNVGIGTTGPTFPLSFAGTTGSKIALYDDGGTTQYGFGIQSGLFQIFADVNTDRVGIGYGTSAAFTETMSITSGNVGIGTTGPTNGKLEIKPASLGNTALAFTNPDGVTRLSSGIHTDENVFFSSNVGYYFVMDSDNNEAASIKFGSNAAVGSE